MAVEIGDVAVAEVVAVVEIPVAKGLAAKVRANLAVNDQNPLLDDRLVISMTNRTMSFWKTMLIWRTFRTSPKRSNLLVVHEGEVRIAENAGSVSNDPIEGIVTALRDRKDPNDQNALNGASDRNVLSDQGGPNAAIDLSVVNALNGVTAANVLKGAIVRIAASGQNVASGQNDIEDVRAVTVARSVKLVSHVKAANLARVVNRVKVVVHLVNVRRHAMSMLVIVDQWSLASLRSFRTSRPGKRPSAVCRCVRQRKIMLVAQRTATRRAITVRLVDGISITL